jgi:hypothetical protein
MTKAARILATMYADWTNAIVGVPGDKPFTYRPNPSQVAEWAFGASLLAGKLDDRTNRRDSAEVYRRWERWNEGRRDLDLHATTDAD